MDTIELSNGSHIHCKAITKIEYDKLMASKVNGPIERLKERYGIEVYQLENGRVIVQEAEYYTLYFSLDDLDKVLLDASGAASNGTEILLNKNRYGSNFPFKTEEMIKELLDELKITNKSLDESLLHKIDSQMMELPDADQFKRKHLIHFIAIIGEVLINKHGAQWDMKLSSDGITWNPYLKIRGQKVEFITYLYEDIYETQNANEPFLINIYETVNDIVKYNIK